MGHAKTIFICIPPSKLQRDTTKRQTPIGRSICVSWNLMETPVLIQGRGGDNLIKIAPWRGLGFWFSLLLLLFGPNSGLLSDGLRAYLYNRGMEG